MRLGCGISSGPAWQMVLFGDISTWLALGLAIGAAALALGLGAVLVTVLLRRRPPAAPDEIRAVREQTARTEALVVDLAHALEGAREESRRSRQLGEIGSTIDLDAVLARTLEATGALPEVDAAMIVIDQDEGGPLISTLGMTTDEAARRSVTGPPDGRWARAVRLSYRYTDEQASEDGELIRGGVAVPLRDEEGEPIGTLAAFWRGSEREVTDADLTMLEEIAASGGPAIENARRFREARQLADLDALTNLHNRRYFHETLAREVARAQRYDRRLALVIFDVDDFKSINDQIGHLAGDAVLAEVAGRVQGVVRSADVACRVGGDEFAVILPESTLTDAEQLYRRLKFAVGSKPAGAADRLRLSAGIAELRPEDDAVMFFERADEALYRAKNAGKGQAAAANNQA